MRRRKFITLAGAVAAWPLVARAQQPPTTTIGFVHSASATFTATLTAGFEQGLKEAGYINGQNLTIEYRWAEGQYDRLPSIIADLIEYRVAAIAAMGGPAPGRTAMAATTTIPIIFVSATDPVAAGLVPSLNRPGGNVTGVSLIGSALEAKRLGLLHQLKRIDARRSHKSKISRRQNPIAGGTRNGRAYRREAHRVEYANRA